MSDVSQKLFTLSCICQFFSTYNIYAIHIIVSECLMYLYIMKKKVHILYLTNTEEMQRPYSDSGYENRRT